MSGIKTEIIKITYSRNEIKNAIKNNDPIEEKLHVIIVISNPCLYNSRYNLANDFIRRIETDNADDVILYIVEYAYANQKFSVTNANNPRHLQIRTNTPIWHKENMINMGVTKLLPKDWKAFAWIDADIEFENASWAKDTLKTLNGCRDIVQIFSHAIDMNKDQQGMSTFNSFGFQYEKELQYTTKGINYWHPGFAWACTRKAYEKMGGLYEKGILGSGDSIMALSIIGFGLKAIKDQSTESYKSSIREFQRNVYGLRLGYVPGVIRHFYHGSKVLRKYTERWEILIKHNYSPADHLVTREDGVLEPSEKCPQELLQDIMGYFRERCEDN